MRRPGHQLLTPAHRTGQQCVVQPHLAHRHVSCRAARGRRRCGGGKRTCGGHRGGCTAVASRPGPRAQRAARRRRAASIVRCLEARRRRAADEQAGPGRRKRKDQCFSFAGLHQRETQPNRKVGRVPHEVGAPLVAGSTHAVVAGGATAVARRRGLTRCRSSAATGTHKAQPAQEACARAPQTCSSSLIASTTSSALSIAASMPAMCATCGERRCCSSPVDAALSQRDALRGVGAAGSVLVMQTGGVWG